MLIQHERLLQAASDSVAAAAPQYTRHQIFHSAIIAVPECAIGQVALKWFRAVDATRSASRKHRCPRQLRPMA